MVSTCSFQVKWVRGKTHYITDALSRAPIFAPVKMPKLDIDTAIAYMSHTNDHILDVILDAMNSNYRQFVNDVKNNTNLPSYHKLLHADQDFLSIDSQLVLLDSRCIVLPKHPSQMCQNYCTQVILASQN